VTADALIRSMTNLEQVTGFPQSAAVRSFLVVMASAAVLSGCAASQQTASTAKSHRKNRIVPFALNTRTGTAASMRKRSPRA
jgi:uncharacterized lipoprotein YajG